MNDIDLMLGSYWEGFKQIFPELKKDRFVSLCEEDYYGGHEEAQHTYPAGRRELKALYCLLRIVKPKNILEIGTFRGDSTNHILLSCERNNVQAKVTTVDIIDYVDEENIHDYPVSRIIARSGDHVRRFKNYDFVVQDGPHDYRLVKSELLAFKDMPNLRFVWGHDYFLKGEGRGVGQAYRDLGGTIFSQWIPFKEDSYPAGFVICRV